MSGPNYPPIPDVARVDLIGVGDLGVGMQVVAQNSIYCRDTVLPWTTAKLIALGDTVRAWWDSNMDTLTSINWQLVRCDVQNLDTVGNPTIQVNFTDIPGTVAGDVWTALVCPVVKFLGDAGGTPSFSYIRGWGAAESQMSGNGLQGGYGGSLETAWAQLATDLSAAVPSQAQVIVSVYEPKATGGGTPATRYRDTGLSNTLDGVVVRNLQGRSVSRQT